MSNRTRYQRTFEELEQVASKFWPAELSALEADLSVVPILLQTQDQFLSIIGIETPDLESLFAIIESATLSANLFLKHLVILSDFGGEMLKRISRELSLIFPNGTLQYLWRGSYHSYSLGVSKSPDIGIIEGMSTCPHCQLEDQQVKAGVNPSGSQRYKCKVCDRRYTAEPHEIGYPQAVRDQAVRLYVDGLNFRRIARTLDVNHQSVINWVNAHVAGLPDTPPLAEGRPEVVELDELFTFVGEKRDKPS